MDPFTTGMIWLGCALVTVVLIFTYVIVRSVRKKPKQADRNFASFKKDCPYRWNTEKRPYCDITRRACKSDDCIGVHIIQWLSDKIVWHNEGGSI